MKRYGVAIHALRGHFQALLVCVETMIDERAELTEEMELHIEKAIERLVELQDMKERLIRAEAFLDEHAPGWRGKDTES